VVKKAEIDQAFLREDIRGTRAEPTHAGALSFARRKYTRDLRGIDVAVTGIPFDLGTTNRPGARFGPRAIRAASTNISWERLDGWEFDAFDRLGVVDYGDCVFDHGRPEEVLAAIESHAREIIGGGAAILALGGDHLVTWPLLRAHAAKHGPLSLVQFDAHSDTWEDEEGRRDHGNMFYHAFREGLIAPERSIQIGLRTYNKDDWGFRQLTSDQVHELGSAAVAARIRETVGDHPVYLTFDIDCLDPAFAPGTGTPVIGGLSSLQARQILRRIAGIRLAGMDVVEVAPAYDVAEITALAGATLGLEMLYLYAAGRDRRSA
jgi:agmatinase